MTWGQDIITLFTLKTIFYCMCKDNLQFIEERIVSLAPNIFLTSVLTSASKSSIRRFVITESWLKAATTAFTFKTLLRHYAKQALTPWSLNVKLGLRRNHHKGRATIRHYANPPSVPYNYCSAVNWVAPRST